MKKILYTFLIAIGLAATNSCSDDSFPVPPASTVPKFTFTIDNDAFAPATVTFKNESIVPERAGTVAYTWNFGDGTSSTEENPQHHYTTPGVYQVNMVVVTGSSLEINDTSITVVVKDPNATGVPLLFTDGSTVFTTLVNDHSPVVESTEIASLSDSYGMAIDTTTDKVYIADFDTEKIYVADADGKNMVVFRENIGDPDAVTIDYDARMLYWDTSTGIRRTSIDLTTDLGDFEDVVTGQANDPEGMAVDPVNKVLYWNNYSGNVWMKKLVGGTETQIVTSGGGAGMVVVDDRIYFETWDAVAAEATLRSANLDGTGVSTVATSITRRIYGMAYEKHGKKIYWGDRNNDIIMRANLDGSAAEPFYSGISARGLTFGRTK
ncbi:PKD repeat-containing protein [Chryseolinea serpens]|uniref:PKD repeat-containing protein n=1 Tax=Chryseolinea serpens TaxID=947013 RepID=A0A1M5JI81_9BACT|nr:PKD domain-containing protein [Chryseolinea serpens]SHG40306.1 PKD repeat-containing protein [Chryseolinea serpens]